MHVIARQWFVSVEWIWYLWCARVRMNMWSWICEFEWEMCANVLRMRLWRNLPKFEKFEVRSRVGHGVLPKTCTQQCRTLNFKFQIHNNQASRIKQTGNAMSTIQGAARTSASMAVIVSFTFLKSNTTFSLQHSQTQHTRRIDLYLSSLSRSVPVKRMPSDLRVVLLSEWGNENERVFVFLCTYLSSSTLRLICGDSLPVAPLKPTNTIEQTLTTTKTHLQCLSQTSTRAEHKQHQPKTNNANNKRTKRT